MDEASLYRLLRDLQDGSVGADEVVRRLQRLPYADLGFARVDHHRALRQGLPEAVYGPGKSVEHCVAIVGELLAEPDGGPVVLSRANPDQAVAVLAAHPGGQQIGWTVYWRPAPTRAEQVAVFAAGTADLPVAEECTATLRALGFEPVVVTDCGVAGVHRLLEHTDLLMAAEAVVVIAGMEGALASLVGGLTPAPVVAVPTSTGYGASLQGVTALLAMLASCAPGLCVVGIDNGFGAAWAVARVLRQGRRLPASDARRRETNPPRTVSRCLRTNEAGTGEAGLLTRVVWWNCFSGIAGDMALASLLDAGADLDVVISGLEKIPVAGWHLEAARTLRGGLAATQLRVDVDPAEEQRERTWAAIRSLIDQADGLPERVRQRAQAVFGRLATAEARLHGVPVDEVHFHEVGGLDAIVDVVGTCLALESLDVASVCSSPVALGNGTVKTAHGLLPVPAPAVIELLKDVPVYGSAQTVELATPTGAALLAGLAEYLGPSPR